MQENEFVVIMLRFFLFAVLFYFSFFFCKLAIILMKLIIMLAWPVWHLDQHILPQFL